MKQFSGPWRDNCWAENLSQQTACALGELSLGRGVKFITHCPQPARGSLKCAFTARGGRVHGAISAVQRRDQWNASRSSGAMRRSSFRAPL